MSIRKRWAIWAVTTSVAAVGLSSFSCAGRPTLGPGDDDSPYRVGLNSPRLTTPQWVGEPGVEAVVILSIDDLTENVPKYESFTRPILDRLKQIDGRAPLSVFTCKSDPKDPGLAPLIAEGVRFDIHTTDHPCPLLQKGDFAAAQRTYRDCVALVSRIPGQKPVAFRMPCCDSMNTVSPRFFAEIFNKVGPSGNFLTIDSSVFTILTPDDPDLPRSVTTLPDGSERFRRYMPKGRPFVNLVENYPYPYPIRRLCWEFPPIVPSDWEAQNAQRPNNPRTTEDLKAALDGVVAKQGVFTFVFHPHGWIEAKAIVELIDHAVARHGPKVKFLTFAEAQERLDRNLLKGHPLRSASGDDGGVRLTDLNGDGHLDVLIGDGETRLTRVWEEGKKSWRDAPLPFSFVDQKSRADAGVQVGRLRGPGGEARTIAVASDRTWEFEAKAARWTSRTERQPWPASMPKASRRLADLDGDGSDELIVAAGDHRAVYRWDETERAWGRAPFDPPESVALIDANGNDAGVRFVDIDEDGDLDLVLSDESRSEIRLFDSKTTGWKEPIPLKKRLPPFVKGGTDMGAWFADRHLWVQNEETSGKPDLVDRRSFNELLEGVEPTRKTPPSSLASIRVRPGFTVELMASEPLVSDPIAFDWGADGRLWVVEMGDYPLGLDGTGKPGGSVKILTDTDGDGRYDKASTFLDGLPFPTGVMPWRKGVLISAAPDVLYAEDTDGDGKADVRRTLLSGFSPGNPQHRVNGFSLGLDGWVYGANGDSGGQIKSLLTGKTASISGRDFRFKPDTGEFEAAAGQAQYGRWRDDWGRAFGNNNSDWGWHYALSEADAARNPAFQPTATRGPLGVPSQVYPISRTPPRFNMPGSANHVTSANSPTPYRDDLFGPDFADALFISEPVHNLIRRVNLVPNGPTVVGRLASDELDREFLASSDNWFRPTSLRTGPDGVLWVADMYRAVIEHPEWIPDDWEARIDLRAGDKEGRIYRVVPVGGKPRPFESLDKLDTDGLVAALESPNGWRRDTAQRLLHHADGRAAQAGLVRLVQGSPRPKTRLQALWTLSNLGAVTAEAALAGLKDVHPQVRRGAARVALGLAKSDLKVAEALVALADDPDTAVRFEFACALGDWPDPRAGAALARIALRDASDPWMRSAVLTSARPHAATILTSLFAKSGTNPPPANLIEPLFASVGVEGGGEALARLRDSILKPQVDGTFADWQFAAFSGLAESGSAALASKGADLGAIAAAVKSILADEDATDRRKELALRALRRIEVAPGEFRNLLKPLLHPRVSPALRSAAIEALGKTQDPRVADLLIEGWKGYPPAARDAVLDTLLSRPAWTGSLLSSLEDTCTPVAEIGGVYRDRLLRHPDAMFRDRAAKLFAASPSTRQAVIDVYASALKTKGDATRGAALFAKSCATCHRLGGVGVEVGPDLTTVGDKAPEALLVAILDPNRAFEARYSAFSVETNDGRLFSGLIANESANAITLRRTNGHEDVLSRKDVATVVGSGRSLMPEGMEKEVTPEGVADLLAFLRSNGAPPKTLEGNRPARVSAGVDGSILLPAKAAEIRGSTLTFEPKYENLGYWSSADDRAAWTFETPQAGRYELWLSYAVAADAAGDILQVDIDGSTVEHRVESTGSWDEYRRVSLGVVSIKAGESRVELRPTQKPKSALLDLRSLELTPVPSK